SLPYQWGIIIGSTFYTLVGLFALRKVLLKFFSDKTTAITLLLLFFGTNYFDQSIFNAELAHNHLFTLYALVLWLTIRWHEDREQKHILWLAVVSGVLILARPSEIIVLLIPLLWGVSGSSNLKNKLTLFKQHKLQLLSFVLVLLLIGSLQVAYWKIFSSDYLYYSYTNAGEGFDFLAPHTLQTLFSFRKGWFVYTPLMVFAVWGFYFTHQYKREIFYPLFVFFLLNLYLVSSWSCWWYANCFSQRALVQSYAVMAIPLGYFIQRLSKSVSFYKGLFAVAAFFLIVLNLFQTWQMRNNILSGDRMTFAYYKKVFAKTTTSPEDQKLLLVNRWLEGKEILEDESGYKSRVLTDFDFENPSKKHNRFFTKELSHNGKTAFQFDSTLLYFNLFESSFEALTEEDHAWLRIEFYVFPQSERAQKDLLLAVSFQHRGKTYKYKALNIRSLPENRSLQTGKWNKISFDYLTPEVRSEKDVLKIYFWNRGRGTVLVDDLTLTVFEPGKGE
ncbi:MAG: hypothetical protein L3J31_02125, partial [Bacteroidales bacterium]|nr:hypothetical protein [Bacteroidales bacterium]